MKQRPGKDLLPLWSFLVTKEGTSEMELPSGCPENVRCSSALSSQSNIACGDNGFLQDALWIEARLL